MHHIFVINAVSDQDNSNSIFPINVIFAMLKYGGIPFDLVYSRLTTAYCLHVSPHWLRHCGVVISVTCFNLSYAIMGGQEGANTRVLLVLILFTSN